jgi:hypothetical protein
MATDYPVLAVMKMVLLFTTAAMKYMGYIKA